MFENMSLDSLEYGHKYNNKNFEKIFEVNNIDNITFTNCKFNDVDFNLSVWLDCTFKDCDFSNINIIKSGFHRCNFTNCRLMGTNFFENTWKNNKVINSLSDYINFGESSLEGCEFSDCRMNYSSFQNIEIKKGLKFSNCDINESEFQGTNLSGVDFHTSNFDNIGVEPRYLRGCTMNFLQLSSIAVNSLGIEIEN